MSIWATARAVTTATFLLAAVTTAAGCASSEEDTSSAEDELRALRAGDVDLEMVGRTPAALPPAKFASVATWSVSYVVMKDPNPENNYRGLLMIGRDKDDNDVYYMPIGWSGAAAAEDAPRSQAAGFIYDAAHPAEDGSLAPVTFDFAAQKNRADQESEAAAMKWLVAEEQRVVTMVREQQAENAQIKTLGKYDGLNCAAQAAAMVLVVNPVAYFVVSGGIDLITGFFEKDVATAAGGAATVAVGGVARAVQKKYGTKGLVRAGVAGAAIGVAWNTYQNGGNLGKGVTETLKSAVPASCQRLLGWEK